MTRLVDDLLDVSRITRGKIELRKEPLDLAAAVRPGRRDGATRWSGSAAADALGVAAGRAGLRRGRPDPAGSRCVGNLLNNAAKYTDPGGRIWLTARREGGEVVLRVRDTGIGIAAGHAAPRLRPVRAGRAARWTARRAGWASA